MRIPSPFRFWQGRAVFGVLLLLCLNPFAAAQGQTPPAKPPKPTAQPAPAPQASQATPKKPGSAPAELDEDGDIIRQREQWFYGQRAYPLGQIPPGVRLKALEHLDKMIQRQNELGLAVAPEQLSTGFPGPTTWTLIGPQGVTGGGGNFGFPIATGRVTALAVDPTDKNTVYLGGANGGVWKSTDGGTTWSIANFDQQPSIAIGSIAIAPSDHNTIYVGTGEENFSGDSYYGAGVMKSTDGGATWVQKGASVFVGPFSAGLFPGGGARIGSIAVHPTNKNLVLAGVQINTGTNTGPLTPGIFCSSDGGDTWTLIPAVSGAAGTGVVYASSTVAYAALGRTFGDPENDVYKSTNADQNCSTQTWTRIHGTGTTLPTQTSLGRIEIAAAPSNPSIIYAAIGDASVGSNNLLGMFKSIDGGANWTNLTATPNFCAGQCWYDMAVRVHPTDPNTVWAGGSAFTNNSSTIWRTTDGGTTWTDMTNGTSSVRPHVDTHALAFDAGGTRLFTGNDGGVWLTDNPGATPVTWVSANNPQLAITQFYPGHSVHPSDENIGFGGTQDNGTEKYTGSLTWQHVTCGDGAWTAVDVNAPTTVYSNCQNIDIRRSFTDGNVGTFTQVRNQIFTSGDFPRVQFIPPFVQDQNISGRLYFGTFRVWQTNDYGDNWSPISPDLSAGTGNITTIAGARSDSNVVYAGTTDGKAQRTINAGAGTGATWSNLTTTDLPPRTITMIAVDKNDANTAFVTFSGFSGFGDTKGHVFKTTNGGASWQDISCHVANCAAPAVSDLPNIPVNDVVIDKDVLNTLYVATDIGVFQTTDGGATWSALNPSNSLPRVPVFSLVLRRQSRILRAATHGRSVWILQLQNVGIPAGPLLTSITPSSKPAGSALFTMTLDGANFLPGSSKVQWNGSPALVTTLSVTANQITASIDASLLTQATLANVSVFDDTQTPKISDNLLFSVTGTPPSISSIVPTSAAVGGPAFTLTVNGSGFVCGGSTATIVRFRGNPHTPVTCSATVMTALIAASEIASSGTAKVIAFAPPPAGGDSNTVFFTVSSPPPANDDWLNAINATPTPFTDTKDTSGATTDTGGRVDPNPSCAVGSRFTTIWYKFTPPSNGSVTADTLGSVYDTVLLAVTGSPGSFVEVSGGCNDDFSGVTSQITISVNSGTTYYFMISGFDSSSNGATTFHLTFTPSGGGNPAVTFNPTSVTFGNQRVGTTSAVTHVHITNSGTATLNITGITLTGTNPGEFSLTSAADGATPACPLGASALNAGNTCNVDAKFGPTSTGAKSASISVTDNAPGSTQTVPLTGTGTAPAVTLSGTTVAFGNVNVNDTKAASPAITLTNSGTGPLTISSIAVGGTNAGDFSQTNTCPVSPATLAPAANCTITPSFKPTATGARGPATLTTTDDANPTTQTVTLSGTGVDFAIAGPPSAVTVTAGQPATFTINLTTTGGPTANAVTFSASGNPAATTVTFNPASIAAGSTTGTTTMTVATTARSAVPPQAPPTGPPRPLLVLWILAAALALMSLALLRRGLRTRRYAVYLPLALLVLGVAGIVSCSSAPAGTPAGTSQITVTATSGTAVHTTTVTLTVN